LGIFNKVVGKEGGDTMGYGGKILKVNENNALTDKTL
jgi:hypothetical protein